MNSPLQSEYRHATILFADVSGFTKMGGKMDPEDLRDVMNACFTELEVAAHHYGGHVLKYLGDCIMVLFGAPTAIENTARAAVNAAIEMRKRIYRVRGNGSIPDFLDIHTGINTGIVDIGEVGGKATRTFDVTGDVVNLASRLKDNSPAGKIWVGRDTQRYTRSEFEYDALEPIPLKNVERPFPIFELRSVDERHFRGSDRLISSPLVGRRIELAALGAAIARVTGGAGGVVRVFGDAGLGKSRLLAEVARLPEGAPALTLEARSMSVGTTTGYHPFVHLFRKWAGITDSDTEAVSFEKLEDATDALLGAAASEVLPFVATLMGMRLPATHADRLAGMSGEGLEKVIAKSVRELVIGLAATHPLVLVFEDLHWADASSIELLDGLIRLIGEHPILFILVYRPDHRGSTSRLLNGLPARLGSSLFDVVLTPLGSKQSDELIQNLLRIPDMPYRLRAEIARKSEGNPFYVEEVVRTLIEEGVVEHTDGTFRLTSRADSVEIPGSIQEIIMTRVDRLPPSARQVAQVAAVIGRRFPYRIIAAVAGRDENALEWDLRMLRRRQLLEECATSAEREFVFTHALTQEAIYESIYTRTRRELHGRVAATIEEHFADRLNEAYAMLAYHWSRAKDRVKAEEYLFKAGDEAARSAASAEALDFFREASRLYMEIHGEKGDPARKALLEKNIGLALLNRGQLLECIHHFDSALLHLGDPLPSGRGSLYRRTARDLAVLLWRVWRCGGRPPVGRTNAAKVESLQIRYNCNRAQTTSDTTRGFCDSVRTLRLLTGTNPGEVDEACGMYAGGAALFAFSGLSFRIGRWFLPIAESLVRDGSVRDQFVFQSYRFLVDYFSGDWRAEWAIAPELVDQAVRYGQMWDVNTYLGMHCEQSIVQGAFDRAQADFEVLSRMSGEYGYEFAVSNRLYMEAYQCLEQRRLPEALAALDRYHQGRQEDNHNLLALGTRTRIHILMGDRAAAAGALEAAEALLTRLGGIAIVPPYFRGTYLASRALFDVTGLELTVDESARASLARAARTSCRAAVRCSRAIARERTPVLRLAGRLEWLLGRHGRAMKHWQESMAEGESLGARPELARTFMEIGRRLLEPDSPVRELGGISATEFLERARAGFEALDLTADLAQLDVVRRAA
ncbi:MAG TPA: adenylate/guanylate cyclase domain-containing protein [Candidatus Binatia bacterium]|nr:adenylate/guanylate cyclase domain-containing protein [Candidatus Binatia bacterium]